MAYGWPSVVDVILMNYPGIKSQLFCVSVVINGLNCPYCLTWSASSARKWVSSRMWL